MNKLTFVAAIVALLSCENNVLAFQPSVCCSISRTSSSLHMTVLTYNGKKKNFKAGTPLKKAVANLGVKPRYSCKKGDCNSCSLSVGGQRIKPCVGKVPPEPRLKSLQEKGLEIR
mmetsp:Transcript_49837/g.53782  ORF Transcript_49837/g.53782 Transcript_49837/m.53782 type:complete len:115 (+) Transcript_49837:155-499(+)